MLDAVEVLYLKHNLIFAVSKTQICPRRHAFVKLVSPGPLRMAISLEENECLTDLSCPSNGLGAGITNLF